MHPIGRPATPRALPRTTIVKALKNWGRPRPRALTGAHGTSRNAVSASRRAG